jgi:hypothetical protein
MRFDNSKSQKYIGVIGTQFTTKVDASDENAVAREITGDKGEVLKTVYEQHLGSSVYGMVTGGGLFKKEIGGRKFLEIQFKMDDDGVVQLSEKIFLKNIAQPLPNVDRTLPLKLSLYMGKNGRGLSLSQTEDPEWDTKDPKCVKWNKLDWNFTKEHPNGIPKATKDEYGDWDFKAHDRFLRGVISDFFDNYVEESSQPALPVDDRPPAEVIDASESQVPEEDEVPL